MSSAHLYATNKHDQQDPNVPILDRDGEDLVDGFQLEVFDVPVVHGGADDLDGVDVLRRVLATSGIEKSATQTIADQWAHAHSASTQSAEYVTIARAVEHGARSAEHDPDLARALADRAQLIRQTAASRLSSRAVPAPIVPFDDAPSRAMAGPEI